MPTSKDRQEANAIKTQYQQVLRLLQGRSSSPVSILLRRIYKETGKKIELSSSACFLSEQTLEQHESLFQGYASALDDALYKCERDAEYQNWKFRRNQFQATLGDFQIHAIMKTEILLAAATQGGGDFSKRHEFTTNDQRFLRSLHIALDKPD